MKNRLYSLLIPWFFDGAVSLTMMVMPLMALRHGADSLLLGTIGWLGQAARMPVAMASGPLSEKVGRKALIVPAIFLVALAAAGLSLSQSNGQIMVAYIVLFVGVGMFYPPLQAMIGEASSADELPKNLGMFNIGWCVGAAITALAAGLLVRISLPFAARVAAAMVLVSVILVATWRAKSPASKTSDESKETTEAPAHSGRLLLISRMGMFTGLFGMSAIRTLFPKVGIELGWTEANVATVVALVVVGLGGGMISANASPWWKGKLWPQVTVQSIMLVSGISMVLSSSPFVLGAAFLATGFSASIAYTSALYQALSSGKSRGRNTGIHEALGASGFIAGCLIGGLVAQGISLRAPYAVLAGLALICIVSTVLLSRDRSQQRTVA